MRICSGGGAGWVKMGRVVVFLVAGFCKSYPCIVPTGAAVLPPVATHSEFVAIFQALQDRDRVCVQRMDARETRPRCATRSRSVRSLQERTCTARGEMAGGRYKKQRVRGQERGELHVHEHV